MKNKCFFGGLLVVLLVIGLVLAACDNGSGGNNPGGSNSGGSSSSGSDSGGSSSGGSSSGGSSSGGSSSGGSDSGGSSSGGSSSGGSDSGGSSSGGSDSGGSSSNVAVSSVSLSKSTITIVNGKDDTVYATISPDNAKNKGLTWSSSSTSIATVTSTTHQVTGQPGGKITGKGPGTATITVKTSDGGKTATCEVTVQPAAPTNVKTTVSAGTIKVDWSSVAGASSYNVYYLDSNSQLVLDGSSNTTSYTSTGWTGTGTIYFKVTALSSGKIESGYTTGATASITNGSGDPKK